jgi:hypothetical protein
MPNLFDPDGRTPSSRPEDGTVFFDHAKRDWRIYRDPTGRNRWQRLVLRIKDTLADKSGARS